MKLPLDLDMLLPLTNRFPCPVPPLGVFSTGVPLRAGGRRRIGALGLSLPLLSSSTEIGAMMCGPRVTGDSDRSVAPIDSDPNRGVNHGADGLTAGSGTLVVLPEIACGLAIGGEHSLDTGGE